MQHRALFAAAVLALVTGCGGPRPSTPVEQGEALLNAGDYDKAIERLSEAIRLSPRDPRAYLNRGRAYQCRNSAGDLNLAITDLTTAIELAPNDPEPRYSRAIAYRDRGKATGSEKDVEQALQDKMEARNLDPESAAIFKKMADNNPSLETDEAKVSRDPAAAAASSAAAVKAAKTGPVETADEAIRRIQARAAAAERQEKQNGAQDAETSLEGSESFSPAPDQPESARERNSRARSRNYDYSHRNQQRLGASQRGGQSGASSFDSTRGGMVGSAPGSVNVPSSPMSPGPGATPRRSLGGTLPPVATSPFARPTPYHSPLDSTATPTSPDASAIQTLYRGPFSSQPPRPTGRVSQPPTTTKQPQAQRFPLGRPRPTNHPPTIRHYDYNP